MMPLIFVNCSLDFGMLSLAFLLPAVVTCVVLCEPTAAGLAVENPVL